MRYVGIRHRVKQTVQEEARPTQVCVIDEDGRLHRYDLDDEQAELDWLRGAYPLTYQPAEVGTDLEQFLPHQVRWKRYKKDDIDKYVHRQNPESKKDDPQIAHVPVAFDGYQEGDRVAIVLSGVSNPLSYALSRRGEVIDAQAYRLPTKQLSDARAQVGRDKEDDALTLAELVRDKVELFYPITTRDRKNIRLVELYRMREQAQKARIACEQRMQQHLIGQVLMTEEGAYPERGLELLFQERKANDVIFQALEQEEKQRNKELEEAVKAFDVYQALFAPIVGVGPMIAARILVAIQDIRRFANKHKLKAYLGAHVLRAGKWGNKLTAITQFPRLRTGLHANWHKDGRQGLYLLSDQFNKRPDSEWGKRLLANKAMYRERHPEPVELEFDDIKFVKNQPLKTGRTVKRRLYTNGHIHNMARWRTITEFVEDLYERWTEHEARIAAGEDPTQTAGASSEESAA